MLMLTGLVITDWWEVRYDEPTLPAQMAAANDHGDHLHYVVHLAVGRVADRCPCAKGIADLQYVKVASHVRTARQLALITTERPTTLRARGADVLGILGRGLHWADAAGTWAVRRAVSAA